MRTVTTSPQPGWAAREAPRSAGWAGMDAGMTAGASLPSFNFLLKFNLRALSGQLGQFSQNEQIGVPAPRSPLVTISGHCPPPDTAASLMPITTRPFCKWTRTACPLLCLPVSLSVVLRASSMCHVSLRFVLMALWSSAVPTHYSFLFIDGG